MRPAIVDVAAAAAISSCDFQSSIHLSPVCVLAVVVVVIICDSPSAQLSCSADSPPSGFVGSTIGGGGGFVIGGIVMRPSRRRQQQRQQPRLLLLLIWSQQQQQFTKPSSAIRPLCRVTSAIHTNCAEWNACCFSLSWGRFKHTCPPTRSPLRPPFI